LTGTSTGFFLTIWSSLIWSLVTGGKDPVSFPPFVIIAFELTILFGGLATVIAVLVLGRLPKLTPSLTYDPRFTPRPFRCGGDVPGSAGRYGQVPPLVGCAEEVGR